MKGNEIKTRLDERGFWDTITNLGGETPKADPRASDVENRAKQQFADRMSNRAMSSFVDAWNYGTIDVNKGVTPQAQAPAGGGQQGGQQGGGQPSAGQQGGGMFGGIKDRLKGMFGGGNKPAQGGAQPGMQTAPGVDPATGKPFAGKPTGAAKPAAGIAQPKPKGPNAPGNTAVPAGQKQGAVKPQVDVNVDKAVKTMRTLQPNGTKPLPAKNAAELNKTLQLVSKNKDYLLIAADKINKFNQAGYNMKPFHNSFMQQFALGKKQKSIQEAFFISEKLFLTDSKYSTWNTMLYNVLNEQDAGNQSPSEFMYDQIKGMLRGYNFEKSPELVKRINGAIKAWDTAFRQQVNKAGGKFNGKFDGATQQAFNNMIQAVANIASASIATGGPGGKAKPASPTAPTA